MLPKPPKVPVVPAASPDQPSQLPLGYSSPQMKQYIERLSRQQMLGQDISKFMPDVAATQRIGYAPTFWEDPQRVARWHNAVVAAPKGWAAPPWLDTAKLAQAYNYFTMQNGNKPWTEWKYLNAQDPGRQYLQNQMQVPPNDFLWPQDKVLATANIAAVKRGEGAWSGLSQDQRQAILTDPTFDIAQWDSKVRGEILADPLFDWSRVPDWQKTYYGLTSSPETWKPFGYDTGYSKSQLVMAAPLALAGGVIGAFGGPVTAGIGAGVGYSMGVQGGKDYDPTKGITQQKTFAAGVMAVLNRLSEFAEQGAGFANQITAKDVEAPLQMITDASQRRAAWEAARVQYETSGSGAVFSDLFAGAGAMASPELWKTYGLLLQGKTKEAQALAADYLNRNPLAGPGEDYIIGRAEPVPAYDMFGNGPNVGSTVMAGWRDKIDTAIEAGATEEEIDALTMQMIGEGNQFIGTQTSDLVFQSIADPLNLAGAIEKQGGRALFKGLADRVGIETPNGKAYSAMANAFSETSGMNDARRRYETIMASMPVDEIKSMDGFAGTVMRYEAGMNTEGQMRAGPFTNEGLLSTPARTTGLRGFLDWTTKLTPESRARVGLGLASNNLLAIFSQFEDPHEIASFFNAVANGDQATAAAMAGTIAGSSEWATVLPALKDFAGLTKDTASKGIVTMPELLAVWEAGGDKRAMLLRVAELMNLEPSKLIDKLSGKADTARMYQVFKDKLTAMADPQATAMLDDMNSGAFTPDDLKSIADIFTGPEAMPWSPQQWKAMVGSAVITHLGDWSVEHLGLKPDSGFFRLAAVMKSAQSVLLLGFNPQFLINNTVNDVVTRAYGGMYGVMTPASVKAWNDRMGFTPYRENAGVSMTGETFDVQGGERAITDAVRGTGKLADVHRFIKTTSGKVTIFSKMSQWVETMESSQATVMAMKDMWGKLWRRDKGFGRMEPALTNALKAIDPNAPDLIYSAIEAGMNRKEIESAIYNRQGAVSVREYVHNAASKLGIGSQEAGVVLDKLGVLDRLDTLLQKARTPEQIRNAFRNVDRYTQDHIEIQRAQELPARMVEVANRVDAEGAPAVMDILADTISRNTDTWIEHYMTFGDVFENIDQIPQAAMRDRLLRDARVTNASRWNKANAWEMTTYRGLMEALHWDKSPEIVDFMRSMDDVNRIKGDTYKAQLDAVDAWSKKWEGQWDNPGRWDDWTAMNAQFDKQFRDMFRAEHEGMIAQGEAMGKAVGLRYGDQVGAAFNKGWADVVRFRDAMVAAVQKFRQDAAGMKYEQRQAAKAQFYQHEYPAMIAQFGDVRKLFGEDLQNAIAGRPPKTPVQPLSSSEKTAQTAEQGNVATTTTNDVLKQAQTELFTELAVEEVARYDAEAIAEEQNVAKIASDHSMPTADENGNPLPNAKLDLIKLVRKYGGVEGAHLRTWKDLAAHPDIVERSFANRDIRIRAQPLLVEPPVVNPDAVPADAAAQVQRAVETGAITPEVADEVQAAIPVSAVDRVHASVTKGGLTFKEYTKLNPWLDQPMNDALTEMARQTSETSGPTKTVLQAINERRGIDQALMRDIVGEEPGRGRKGIPPGLFRKNGVALDTVATWLVEDNFMLQSVIDDGNGSQAAGDLIRRAVAGEKILPIDMKVDPDWIKRAGGGKNAGMLVGQIIAGVEDPSAKRVQSIKSDAYAYMIEHIQEYPDARTALKLPFDEHTSPIVEQIAAFETSVNDLVGMDISDTIAEASRLYESLPEDAPANLHARLDAALEKVFAAESETRLKSESDRVTAEAQFNADRVWNRDLFEEKLRETMPNMPEDKVIGTMAIMDAFQKYLDRVDPGANAYELYSGMDRSGTGDLMQNAPFGQDAVGRPMTPEAWNNLAGAIVRKGEAFVKQAVLDEQLKSNRLALLDAVHNLDPQMAENVLMQTRNVLFQETKGGVTFLPDKSAILHFFEGADVTTVVHENAHVWRRMMQDIAERGNLEVRADLTTLEKWAGVKDGVWDVPAEEKFARGFERYLAEGIAPTPALVKVFENFKRWMLEVYKSITGSPIDVNITPEVKDVFDRLMGQEPMDEPIRVPQQAPALHQVGDIVRLQDGTQATITAVRPDATLELDNGKVVSAAAVERVASQDNMFGEAPPTQQTQLFQSADPRMPFGYYDEQAGVLGRPEAQIMDEGWEQHVRPLLQALEDEAIRRSQERPLQVGGADDVTQAALAKYLGKVYQDQAATKLQTARWGESQRDFALLNYNRRYGFDKMADVAYPYQFWYTRSMMNWAKRALDRPGLMAFYSRIKMASNRYENNLPERLRGRIAIPTPFLPDWMGGTLYIDPLKQIFPWAQMLRPFETMQQDKNQQVIDAERLLQEWSVDGKITTDEAQQAAQTQTGATWDEAIAQANLNRTSEISNPFDFMNVMLGPAWYLSTPYKALTGQANTIQETPLTRTANAAQAVLEGSWAEPIGNLIGLLGKPENWIREKAGMPPNSEYGDYYIDRQLSNMVSDGEISAQEADLAMMERTGPAFDGAVQRVKMELAVRVPGAATLYALTHGATVQQIAASVPVSTFGAQILPTGELKSRGLYDKWNAAWDKYDAGDKEAINQFFTDYPEYEAYLARKKTPEERLRGFLQGQVWDSYMSLDRADKRMVKAQMGDLFQQSFLDINTRDYTAIDIDTLAFWARYLKGVVPQVPETATVTDIPQAQMGAPTLMPENISVQLKSWEAERDSRYPGILDIQSMYYGLPENKRDAFKVNFPQYSQYLTWRKTYIASHPDVRPFIDSYYAQDVLSGKVDASQETLGLLKLYYSQDYQDPLYGAADYLKDASQVLWEQLFDYQLLHQRPSEAAMTELRTVWEAAGKPGETLTVFLDDIIMPTLNQ